MWNLKPYILIAEDDPNDAELLRRTLKKTGITNPLQIVSDGEEALYYLKGEGKYADRNAYPFPSMIITDLKMPRRNGFDVLDWTKRHPECSVIPVIVWTSSSDVKDVTRAYQLGANCYLQKPTNPRDFEERVRLIFQFWDSCEQPPLTFSSCAEDNPPDKK